MLYSNQGFCLVSDLKLIVIFSICKYTEISKIEQKTFENVLFKVQFSELRIIKADHLMMRQYFFVLQPSDSHLDMVISSYRNIYTYLTYMLTR